jgi:ParB family chromosome partitioning protein
VAAGGGRAGEGDLVDVGVGDEVLADLAPGRDDVHHARGEAGVLEDLAEGLGRQRRLGRRLEHDGAPGDEGGSQLDHGLEQRDVPRDDGGDDAVGHLAHLGRAHHAGPHLRELVGVGQPDVLVGDHAGGEHLAHHGPGHRTAHLAGDQLGQALHVGGDGARDGGQDGAPLLGAHGGPGPVVEGLAGGGDGRVHVADGPLRHPAEQLLGRRVDHVDRPRPPGRDPVTADEERVVDDGLSHGYRSPGQVSSR